MKFHDVFHQFCQMQKLPWHFVKFPDNSLTLRNFISPWHFPDGYEPCNITLLFYSTFSFFAILGVKDRTLYLIQVHLHETGNARPRFVYLVYFLEIFAKKIKSPFTPTTFVAHLQKKFYSNLLPSHLVCNDSQLVHNKSTSSINARFYSDTRISLYDFHQKWQVSL